VTAAGAATGGAWELRPVPCDYCGSTEADPLLSGRDRAHGLPGEFSVVVCRKCGLARTDPQPTPESLGMAYPKSYEDHQLRAGVAAPPTGLLRWALVNGRDYPLGRPAPPGLRMLVRPLARLVLNRRRGIGYVRYQGQGRLLDFGCGTGKYVARMAAAGWKAAGLDLSAKAVRAARAAGLEVREGTLPGADYPPESFDAVTMWASLEHVPSPLATLRAACALLRPGGRLLVCCPCLNSLWAPWFGSAWQGLQLPRHLTHFTEATLRRHLEKAGFAVQRVWADGRPGFIRRSFALLAADTGRGIHRRLSRSRFLVGLMSLAGILTRRPGAVIVLARRAAPSAQTA